MLAHAKYTATKFSLFREDLGGVYESINLREQHQKGRRPTPIQTFPLNGKGFYLWVLSLIFEFVFCLTSLLFKNVYSQLYSGKVLPFQGRI